MAALIDGILLRGFKSLADTSLSIERLNVLIGANGTGKSNFLGLFRMLGAILAGELQAYVLAQGGASSLLHYGPKETGAIELEIEFIDRGKPSQYEVTLGYSPADRLQVIQEAVSRHVDSENLQALVDGNPRSESSLEEMISRGGDLSEVARVVRANLAGIRVYHFHDTSDTAAAKQTADLNDNRSLRRDAGNLASFLYMLRQAHPAHYAEIRETVRLAFPLFGDFVLEPSRLNPNALLLRWRERGSEYELGAHQLSDGTLRFICLATLLLQPFDHPDAPRVVVIDEPELGLHPYALTLLATMLKSASERAQVIVSTQSASLLGAIDEPTAIVIVERHDGATTLRRCTAEEVAPWLEEYSLGDIWEKGILGGRP